MQSSSPAPRFYTETVTLAEHQLLKRIRQLCKNDGTVILIIEIVTREKLQAGVAMQKLE
jgi:hypothetical protein